jgi:erythromycin esterase-like protein
MPFVRIRVVLASLACLSICSFARDATPVRGNPQTPSAADAVVHDLCDKNVALLGESPTHGFGRTLQFKAELVQRLVKDCHYDTFFIESGIYDFLNIQKKLKAGQEITRPMVAAAIGGLWAASEVEPLIPFLVETATSGAVVLGGLDDQLARGTYAQRKMPADLVQYLLGNLKQKCLSILERHTLWQYSSESPYGPKDKALILGCLDRIDAAASRARTSNAPYDLAMVASLRRSFARDFRDNAGLEVNPQILDINDRDRSMYQNFQWLMSRLPPHRKVIVWTATTHAAKDLTGVPGQQARVSLGSDIRHAFKDNAFALGFSAYSGTYGMVGQPARLLSVAPAASLEGRAFANNSSDTRYFDLDQLRRFGAIAARPTSLDFQTAKWDVAFDGMVIFREEHPPDFSK